MSRRLVSNAEVREAVSWRVGSDVLLWGCTYVLTGNPKVSLAITGLYSLVSIIAYVPHARWWRRHEAVKALQSAARSGEAVASEQ